MSYELPPILQEGDMVRVIAPSLSGTVISEETRAYAKGVFEQDLGLRVTFSQHIEERDQCNSSRVDSRVADLHEAFEDPDVKAVMPIIGGWNSNQLLDRIDWELIKANPKVFCGFSDITALGNAMLAKAGLITYFGPNYSTFGQKHLDPYTVECFRRSVFDNRPWAVNPAREWTDDKWFLDQEDHRPRNNEGFWRMQSGAGEGVIIGGTLSVLSLLQGTDYFPQDKNIVLFLEEESRASVEAFDAHLQSLLQTTRRNGQKIAALVLGRFQLASNVTSKTLEAALGNKQELSGIPVVANVDFGHTDPKITFPLGGIARVAVAEDSASIQVTA